ncbi:MAG: hypothetical protein ACYSWS_12350 [Planctomycetota bacterium]|jgi:hypothetical protein
MYKKFYMRFGQYIFKFLCESQEVIDFLRFYFIEYTSDPTSSVQIIVSIVPSTKISMMRTGARYTYSVNKGRFNFGPNLIQGGWDGSEKYYLFISSFLLRAEEVWLLNRFLCRLFYTLSALLF